jgi:hypothetical protein
MKPGDVYIKSLKDHDIFRRIVNIHQGVVCYSRGTDTNGLCKVESFQKWASNKKVRLATPDDPRFNDSQVDEKERNRRFGQPHFGHSEAE